MAEERLRAARLCAPGAKDLEMLASAAAGAHVAMPMASQALTLYRMPAASGRAELDASTVVDLYGRAERG